MFVQPNTNVWLMKGCKLRPNYEDTYYFSNAQQQFSFLTRNLVGSYTNQSYQRYGNNAIQLQGKIKDLFKANYMAFENSEHEDRIFYAFITDVEYVNENTVRLYYAIDYIQSFLFDFELLDCFVDRMHSKTDEIGDNIKPEPVQIGEMNKVNNYTIDLSPCIALYIVTDAETGMPVNNPFKFSGNIYNPSYAYGFPYTSTGANAAQGKLDYYTENGTEAGIVSLQLMPAFCMKNVEGYSIAVIQPSSQTFYTQKPNNSTTLSGYLPKNKKLLTYPYYYLSVISLNNQAAFAYEFFGGTPEFFVYCGGSPSDAVHCRAVDYQRQNLSEEDVTFYYPPLAYNINTYEAWKARQMTTMPQRVLGAGIAVAKTIVDIYAFKGMNTALSIAHEAASNSSYINESRRLSAANAGGIAQINLQNRYDNNLNIQRNITTARNNYHTANALSSTAGSVINDTLQLWAQEKLERLSQISTQGAFVDQSNLMSGNYNFKCYDVQLRYAEAKQIDDFFTAYGYSQKEILRPSIHNRTGWTYIKTVGCELTSETVHNGILEAISALFDKGIRFWVAGVAEIGNYSTSNNPL